MLENLKALREDMQKKGWTISSFLFVYKHIEYIVLVKRFVGDEKKANTYAMVKLHFLKSNNLDDDLIVEANTHCLIVDAKTLREYFGIEYNDNLGDVLNQFTNRLGSFIPDHVRDDITNRERKAMVRSLSISDSEDPNKIYCSHVKRNTNGEHRSEYNSDKTKLLRPSLFNFFCDDNTISFCYFAEPSKEKDDSTILENFAKNHNC